MSFLASSTHTGVDAEPPIEFRPFIRAVLKEELHDVVHERIGDLQAQQSSLKQQQAVCMETMIQHMDRIEETLARCEKKMTRCIQMDPYKNGANIVPLASVEQTSSLDSDTVDSELYAEAGTLSSRSQTCSVTHFRQSRSVDSTGSQASRAQAFIDELEEMEEVEEEKDLEFKMALIRKIPNQSLARCLMRLLTFVEELKEPERTSFASKIEKSRSFHFLTMMFILADQVMTIVDTNRAAADLDTNKPGIFLLAEKVFLAWFALELGLRLFVHRLYFLILDHWQMNWLDIFLVTYSAFEQSGISLAVMRALRIFKLAKVVRLLKALKEVRDLRVMMDCLLSSWFALVWAAVLVGFITYIFALIFVQSITLYMTENPDALDPNMEQVAREQFGSVQRAIVSLCKTFFGGFDWGDMYDLLLQIGPLTASLGVFFALFFSISVWNIVGSIFVEKVMDTAKPQPREILEIARIQSRCDYSAMKQFFDHVDADDDGTISRREWKQIFEQTGIQEFMAVRDVDLRDNADVNAFFVLAQQEQRTMRYLGRARGDAVPKEAFMRVFQKVKGHASKLQVEVMLHELRARQGQILQILGLLRRQPLLTEPRLTEELRGPCLPSVKSCDV